MLKSFEIKTCENNLFAARNLSVGEIDNNIGRQFNYNLSCSIQA